MIAGWDDKSTSALNGLGFSRLLTVALCVPSLQVSPAMKAGSFFCEENAELGNVLKLLQAAQR